MHTTLKTVLFSASMLVGASLQAGVADSLNAGEMPAYNGDDGIYSANLFVSNSISYTYVPQFDYTLTGIYTRFADAGILGDAGYRQITLELYAADPFTSGDPALRSFSFDLIPGTFDIVPGPAELLTGTDWLGGNLADLSLIGGTSYYIRLSGLVDPNSGWAAGVNFAHLATMSSLSDFGNAYQTTAVQTQWMTGQEQLTTLYTDPIFQFQGVTPVPEPSTYGLLGAFGLMCFAAYRRRFARKV